MPSSAPSDGDDGSTSTAASPAPLPFSHVTTPSLVQELNSFEESLQAQYETLFARQTSKTELPVNVNNGANRLEKECHPTNASIEDPAPDDLADVLPTSWSEIAIESVLGQGAFSFVFQVQFEPTATRTAVNHMSQKYALKCLKAKSVHTSDDLIQNAMDLCSEAKILSLVSHPHIIQLVGATNISLGDSYQKDNGFFVLLEIMETTLLDSLTDWRNDILTSRQEQRRLQSRASVQERLKSIGIPTASAIAYLHQSEIVLRDLKPENIGFDTHGQVKLFDFGLARPVAQVDAQDVAGSPCYMAPEILLEHGTSLASDVYSLSILIWELCTLELPMARFDTLAEIQHHVAKKHWRPNLSGPALKALPKGVLRQRTLPKGWHKKVGERPSVTEFIDSLKAECGSAGDQTDTTTSQRRGEDRRSRSRGSMRNFFRSLS